MEISASLTNTGDNNMVEVQTNGQVKSISIPAKINGQGSSVNGGELLCLALATCCCNDIYREASKRKMIIDSVSVIVAAKFGNEGEPASRITYQVNVQSPHSKQEIHALVAYVNNIAEIHNTLRMGIQVNLQSVNESSFSETHFPPA